MIQFWPNNIDFIASPLHTLVNIGSGSGLMPDGIRLYYDPILAQITLTSYCHQYWLALAQVTVWCHQAIT